MSKKYNKKSKSEFKLKCCEKYNKKSSTYCKRCPKMLNI